MARGTPLAYGLFFVTECEFSFGMYKIHDVKSFPAHDDDNTVSMMNDDLSVFHGP